MTQTVFTDINPATKTGSQLATDLNNFKASLLSNHSGTAAPTYIVAGQTWVDTTANPWILKFYDGTDHIVMGTIDITANIFIPGSGALPIANGGTGAITAAAAFAALKQAATTSATGVVELATATEVNTGTDTSRVVTPSTLQSWNQGLVSGTSTTVNNSTTPVPITGLTKTISGSNFFAIDIFLELDQSASGANLKVGLISGAGSVGSGVWDITDGTTGFEIRSQENFTNSGTSPVSLIAPAASNLVLRGRFMVDRGSGSAFYVYFAQATAVASDTTISRSWMSVRELS